MKLFVIFVAQIILFASCSPAPQTHIETNEVRELFGNDSDNSTVETDDESADDHPVYIIHQVIIQKHYNYGSNCSAEPKVEVEEDVEREKRNVIGWIKEKLGIESENDTTEEATTNTESFTTAESSEATKSEVKPSTEKLEKRDADEQETAEEGTSAAVQPMTIPAEIEVTTYAHGLRGRRQATSTMAAEDSAAAANSPASTQVPPPAEK